MLLHGLLVVYIKHNKEYNFINGYNLKIVNYHKIKNKIKQYSIIILVLMIIK
jgi:hypothetical protein